MKYFFKYIKREYKLLMPFIITVINVQNLEFFFRVNYPASSFVISPYFLSFAIICDMMIAALYILLTLWNHVKMNNLDNNYISDSIKKHYIVYNGNAPDYNIYNFKYISGKERSISKNEEIWIVSENLSDDIFHPDLSKIVEENLKKGVTYCYFVVKDSPLADPTLIYSIDLLENKHRKYLDKTLFIIYLEEKLIVPEAYIIIYNATSDTRRKGYFAVEIGNDTKSYLYQ